MSPSSSRIDLAARRLLSSIAGTRNAWVSAMALAHMRGADKALMDAGLLVQRGSAISVVAEDDLDDTLTTVIAHPITGHHGHLGNAAWHDEPASVRPLVNPKTIRIDDDSEFISHDLDLWVYAKQVILDAHGPASPPTTASSRHSTASRMPNA